ncbi:Electron transfer flavoprotein, alpha subunit [Olavius algarvensis associated proteobacterium Delta 3]|nr:Electron transfer flavoprotein, alpha subunit [Olavius algarvensis associated proteobacterium Delta 3]
MSNLVLAITEQIDGQFRKVTFEALSEGRRIASATGGSLAALVLGSDVGSLADELGKYGADRVLVADNGALADYTTGAYTNVVGALIHQESPAVVVIGATAQGKDLSARLSARLDAPLAMDCVAVSIDDGQLTVTRPMYGGKILAEVQMDGDPKIIALRPNAIAITEADGGGAVESLEIDPGESKIKVLEKTLETGKVELTEADIIVSGGRGMGGSDYSVIETLADLLGAAVGASRSAVDEGWRPHSDQVGQTGKVVSPNLYLACGISGAIQHLAGMGSSKVIVAINKDPEAPIFAKADYGIVDDLFEVIPCITAEVKRIK